MKSDRRRICNNCSFYRRYGDLRGQYNRYYCVTAPAVRVSPLYGGIIYYVDCCKRNEKLTCPFFQQKKWWENLLFWR